MRVLCLTLGPVLGSFITEPAAMTVSALLLLEGFFSQKVSMRFKYFTLGVLFVNISIGELSLTTPRASGSDGGASAELVWLLCFGILA